MQLLELENPVGTGIGGANNETGAATLQWNS
jgi:hypothetical protein